MFHNKMIGGRVLNVWKWKFRTRLAVLCGLLLAPLLLLLLLQIGRIRDDLAFVGRELRDVEALRATWVRIQEDPGVGAADLALAAVPVLILDPHSETYHLADALTFSLLQLGILPAGPGSAEPAARAEAALLSRQAARDLKAAADSLPRGAVRRALEGRVARLDALAAAPEKITTAEARSLWAATADDLETLLRLRREGMLRQSVWGGLLVGGFVLLACVLALTLARGVQNRVEGLVEQIDRLAENDTARRTPFLEDPNEIGRIATGVEALRLSLIDAREAWGHVLLNEMRHALLAENTRAIVLLTDFAGVVLCCSPASARLEFDPDAIEGAPIWNLFAPADAQALRESLPRKVGQILRRQCHLPEALGGIIQWDACVSLSDEQDDALVFLLAPSADQAAGPPI